MKKVILLCVCLSICTGCSNPFGGQKSSSGSINSITYLDYASENIDPSFWTGGTPDQTAFYNFWIHYDGDFEYSDIDYARVYLADGRYWIINYEEYMLNNAAKYVGGWGRWYIGDTLNVLPIGPLRAEIRLKNGQSSTHTADIPAPGSTTTGGYSTMHSQDNTSPPPDSAPMVARAIPSKSSFLRYQDQSVCIYFSVTDAKIFNGRVVFRDSADATVGYSPYFVNPQTGTANSQYMGTTTFHTDGTTNLATFPASDIDFLSGKSFSDIAKYYIVLYDGAQYGMQSDGEILYDSLSRSAVEAISNTIIIASDVAPPDSNIQYPGVPSIASDGNNYLVVYRRGDSTTGALCATLLSKTGVILNSLQIDDHGGNRPATAFDGTNYLVASAGPNGSVVGHRISTAGVNLDGNSGFSISTGTAIPALAFDGTNYMVLWGRYVNPGGYDIYGATVSPSGQVFSEFAVTTRPGEQIMPALAFDGTNYFAVWRDTFSGSGPSLDTHIYGTRIAPDGTVLDPDGIPITTAAGTQCSPKIVFDGTNYFAVWMQNASSGSPMFILGKRIRTDGTLIDYGSSEQGIAINTSSYGEKGYPSVAFDGTKFLVVWTYLTFSSHTPAGIYGANVSIEGVVEGSPTSAGLSISGPPPKYARFAYPVVSYGGVNYLVVWSNVSEIAGTPKDIRGILLTTDLNFRSAMKGNRALVPSRYESDLIRYQSEM